MNSNYPSVYGGKRSSAPKKGTVLRAPQNAGAFYFTSVFIFFVFIFSSPLSCQDNSGSWEPVSGDDDSSEAPGQGTWTDSSSSLIWQNPPANDPSWGMTWVDAKAYCDSLELGGYSDWRLPTISELRSLIRDCPAVEPGGSCPLTDDCTSYDCWDSDTCDGCEFEAGPASGCYWPSALEGDCTNHWSSSKHDDDAWNIDFRSAILWDDYIQGPYYIARCVH